LTDHGDADEGGTGNPPWTVIVVHGVGNQAEGETARSLGLSLARELSKEHFRAHTLSAADSVVSAPPSLPDGNVEAPAFSLREEGSAGDRARIYELYWANESRVGEFIVSQVISFWQLFVGVPRLGLIALDYTPARGRAALTVFRGVYVLVWLLIVLRMLYASALAALRVPTRLGALHSDELALPLDMMVSAVLCILLLTAVWLCRAVRDRPRGVAVALMSLSAAVLLTATVPNALHGLPNLRDRPRVEGGAIADDRAAGKPTSPGGSSPLAPAAREPWLRFPVAGITAEWFYAPYHLGGFWPYVNYALVLLWVGLSALALGWTTYTPGLADSCRKDITAKITRSMSATWLLISWCVLFLGPLLDMFILLQIFVFKTVPWDGFVSAAGNPHVVAHTVEAYALAAQWIYYPFVALTVGLLFSSKLRTLLAPALELVLDVMNYLSPVGGVDRYAALRFLSGGRPGARTTPLRDQLDDRLWTLIRLACQARGGPVMIVAHSLGSIIALSALRRGLRSPEVSEVVPASPCVKLVTIGSPLMVLAWAFPDLFDSRRAGQGPWDLHGVSLWANAFYASDVIGRDLVSGTAVVAPSQGTREENLGQGLHTDYFPDSRFARFLLSL
jgi:hypothetical protein